MSREKIAQLVGSLAKSIEDKERIATPVLAAKLAKAVTAYPGDQTIGAMSRVISKMASNNTLFIRKGELKTLYNKMYSRNTKFAQLFGDELGAIDTLATPQLYERDESTQEVNPFQVADPVLANALNSVFDKHIPLKLYSQDLANKALHAVAASLDVWNLRPTSLVVDDGNDKFLVIRAYYETPKGVTSFFVPVETRNNQVTEASVFMGNAGPQTLNHTAIKSYLTSLAGQKLKINGASILNVLTKAASENREVSDAEIALTKLTAIRQGKSEFFQNQIVGQKVAEAGKKDVQLPKSNEFETFEQKFHSPQGIAELNFGASTVKVAREHVAREILGFGYKNPQISVYGSENSTIYLSVALNDGRLGFVVPVKVDGNRISKPAVLLCNGSVGPFSQDGINTLAVKNASDFKAAATASPLFGLGPADLLNNLRTALAEENTDKAEDVLNVLANTGNVQAYATGFQMFKDGLLNKKAAPETKCNHMIKTSTSEHPICSHTGLPAHKVYQDKDGNCRPLYRRGMDESYEGAIFNNSKVFG